MNADKDEDEDEEDDDESSIQFREAVKKRLPLRSLSVPSRSIEHAKSTWHTTTKAMMIRRKSEEEGENAKKDFSDGLFDSPSVAEKNSPVEMLTSSSSNRHISIKCLSSLGTSHSPAEASNDD